MKTKLQAVENELAAVAAELALVATGNGATIKGTPQQIAGRLLQRIHAAAGHLAGLYGDANAIESNLLRIRQSLLAAAGVLVGDAVSAQAPTAGAPTPTATATASPPPDATAKPTAAAPKAGAKPAAASPTAAGNYPCSRAACVFDRALEDAIKAGKVSVFSVGAAPFNGAANGVNLG